MFIPAHVLLVPPAALAGVAHHTGLRTGPPQVASLSKAQIHQMKIRMWICGRVWSPVPLQRRADVWCAVGLGAVPRWLAGQVGCID